VRRRRTGKQAADGHETVRLHLVALASEIVVLVALIDQELKHAQGSEPRAQEIRHDCLGHLHAAGSLLSTGMTSEDYALEDLWRATYVFHARVQDVRHLRECAEDMRPRKAVRASRVAGPARRARQAA
jgi:hypothetical protein